MTTTHQDDEAFVRLVVFNVGQRSCVLLSLPPARGQETRRYAVVDCGTSEAAPVRWYLDNPPFADETPPEAEPLPLEFVALTHYHSDHFNGIDSLLGAGGSGFRALRYLAPMVSPRRLAEGRYDPGSPEARRLESIWRLTWGRCLTPRGRREGPQMDFLYYDQPYGWAADIDPRLGLRALAPSAQACREQEDALEADGLDGAALYSGALRLQFGRTVAVFGGDVDEEEWGRVITAWRRPEDALASNVAIVPHHGGSGNLRDVWEATSRLSGTAFRGLAVSRTPTTRERFREHNSKTVAVISCGSSSDAVPSRMTLWRLAHTTTKVLCTSPARVCMSLTGTPPCLLPDEGQPTPAAPPMPKGACPAARSRVPPFLASRYVTPDRFIRGAVCVKLFAQQAPQVDHLYRQHPAGDCPDQFLFFPA